MSYASSPSSALFDIAMSSNPSPTPSPQRSQSTLLRTNSSYQPNLVDLPIEPMTAHADKHAQSQVHLDILSDDTLCLTPVPSRPPWFSRLTYLTFLGCLGFMIYCGVQGILLGMKNQQNETIIMWSCFAGVPLLILIGALIYPLFKPGPLQFRFDRDTRLLTVQRCTGLSKTPRLMATFSLDDVVALQLLFRYYKAVQAGVEMNKMKKESYEMNLVFHNTNIPRINLAVHGDWRWMRQAGARLAEFLDIPVADQLCRQ